MSADPRLAAAYPRLATAFECPRLGAMLKGSVSLARPLASAGLIVALILTGCGGEPAPGPTGGVTQSAPTGEDDEAGPDENVGEEQPAGEEPTAAGEGLGEIDGVTTERLAELPETIGDMSRTDVRANPDQHVAAVDYAADDGVTTLRYTAYLPNLQGQLHVLDGTEDDLFTEMTNVSREFMEEEGDEIRAFELDAGSHAWTCFEALRAGGSDDDHTQCHTVAYGRMVATEYITLHDEDQLAREDNLSSHLGEFGDALAAMP